MKSTRQSGFTIVSAIFILVVLAALGAFMVTVSTTQQIGSALDVQGSRAYQAARSGAEWGIYKVQETCNFGHTASCTRTCPTSPTSFSLPAAATTLAGLIVTVTCEATTDPRGLGGPTIYTVTATACNQPLVGWTGTTVACPNTANPTGFYIERQLEVSF